MRGTENGLLKFVICGSVDDGKSTLLGHLLYDSKLLYADQKQALILDSKVGSRGGAIDYSLLLDGLMAEREEGITIDVAYRYFTTDARSFIAADAPGHEEYTRNMAVGASFADLAVILVDASQGVLVQTRRHARICALMGIRTFLFAVNKMDLIGYRKERFDAIVKDLEDLQKELSIEQATAIPISATEGDNITKPSANMPWYHGPTLLRELETADPSRSPEIGFYMPVQRVSRPNYTFRGFQGQVECGTVRVGDRVTALPSGERAMVKQILVGDREAEAASAGRPVTVRLDREVDVSRGCVLEKDARLKVGKTFSATLLWMDDDPLLPEGEYWIKLGTKMLPCVVGGVKYQVDVNTGKHLPVQTVSKNAIVRCELALSQKMVLDRFSRHKTMGEMILINRVTHATSACGVVEDIDTAGDRGAVFEDGDRRVSLPIFDGFYYRRDLNAVVRHSAETAVYRKGDLLPLRAGTYRYPDDFDVRAGQSADVLLRVRGGKFAGFGKRDPAVPLLDGRGLPLNGERSADDFETYRRVAVWEDGHEI